jgi:hypothetical protein
MKRTKVKAEYQQSSRDASEEDVGDSDSIPSIYDSVADSIPPHQIKRPTKQTLLSRYCDEGENSATTSDASPGNRIPQTRRKPEHELVKAVDIVNRQYVDVNSTSGRRMNPPPTDRPVRIYSDGIFDLFHLGYVCFHCYF